MKNWCWLLIPILINCTKKNAENASGNTSPQVSLIAELISVSPFTFKFIAVESDREFDAVTYTWNFGDGPTKPGRATEEFSYEADKDYNVKLTVDDGKSASVTTSILINTKSTTVAIDCSMTFQTMEGFGGSWFPGAVIL